MNSLDRRLKDLEKTVTMSREPKKRCLPEWLQECYEQNGFVFDAEGQVLSGPSLSDQG